MALIRNILSFTTMSLFFTGTVFLVSCRGHSAASGSAGPSPEDSRQAAKTISVSISSFDETKRVSLTPVGQNGFFSNMTVVDTFLVCVDYRSPQVLEVFSVFSDQSLGHLIRRGEQPGQCLGVSSILRGDKKGTCWLYDITLGKLLKTDIRKALTDSTYTGEEEIALSNQTKRAKSPVWVNDSVLAACTYARGDCRYLYFNRSSEITGKAGTLPGSAEKWPSGKRDNVFDIRASVYAANLVRHPEKDMFVASCNKTDRLEFYRRDTLFKIIRGPDHFEPIVSFSEDGGYIDVTETAQTRYAYTAIFSDPQWIYILYSGKDNYNTCTERLLVFDWDGRPVRSIVFDREICSFTISGVTGKKLIYAVEKNTGNLCKGEL